MPDAPVPKQLSGCPLQLSVPSRIRPFKIFYTAADLKWAHTGGVTGAVHFE